MQVEYMLCFIQDRPEGYTNNYPHTSRSINRGY